jgi:hypothetical protein
MYGGTYNNDFGCTYSQYFYTDWPAGVDELAPEVAGLMVYPNPARDIVHIDLSGLPSVNGVLTITDAMGRVVYNEAIAQASVQLATSRFAAGAYVFTYTDVAGNRLRSQLVIAR